MDIFGFIKLLGGLALFLYGMTLLGSSLERASGGRLERTIEKMTDNVFKGVALGALVTAAIQSSSAMTVIVVGLVNAKVLKLRNAIGLIMGANIGTTITAHILRLSDLESSNLFLMILKPTTLAPLLSLIGILLFMGAKRDRLRNVGAIMIGIGILFSGMFAMEAAVLPLKDEPWFTALFATFENPVIGILVGTLVTAAIQSSAASIGILQALSATGFVTCGMAFPIIMGQNIGTCITPVLAAIGASKNAKRTAAVHVTFNVLGTIIFVTACYSLLYLGFFPFWNDPITRGGIANFHTIFNIVTTFLFLPFTAILEKIACRVVRDKPGDDEHDITAAALDERLMVSPGLAVEHVQDAVVQMAMLARHNVLNAVSLLSNYDPKKRERIDEAESVVDKMEDRVETYLLKLGEHELADSESRKISQLLHTCGEFERIADHAQNIAESADRLYEAKSAFSKKALEELENISEAVTEVLDLAIEAFQNKNIDAAMDIGPLEEIVDELEQSYKDRHVDRLRKGKCSIDVAFPFVEALSNLERVADLCSNVGESVITYDGAHESIDRHAYQQLTRDEQDGDYKRKYAYFDAKYVHREKEKEKNKSKVKV